MATIDSAKPNETLRSEVMIPFAVMTLIVTLIIPLPTILIDVLLTMNIGFVILLLLVVLGIKQPLDLSVFPSVLLLTTLARLSLNVATTRLILLQADAGQVVATFGNFVVGGSLVVGLVIFLILIVIQFVVITRGATRISEVGARFILDAMPGKQMSIDADLNAGIINDAESRRRRELLVQEAEFYGAMDGASKFVRGDAIAGVIITAINLLGGIILGLTNGMSIGEALQTYSILAVGDGLVSQIPAVVVATAAGIVITKSTSGFSLGPEITNQFLNHRTPLVVGAVILTILSLAPGLPKIPFLALAAILFVASRRLPIGDVVPDKEEEPVVTSSPIEDHLGKFLETDVARVEIGARLIPIVDPKRGLSLLQQIASLRRDLARRSGLWVPLVRVRDNMQLDPEQYRILLGGQEVARGEIRIGSLLAIHSEGAPITLPGEDTIDPAFGLPAKWISEADRARAEIAGCTVVDAPSALITHLREILRKHAGELLSREDLNRLVDRVKESSPAVVEELIPNILSMGTVHRILSLLLDERVPITNLTRILESLSHHAVINKDAEELTELVRRDMARAICDPYVNEQGRIHAIVFDPMLELQLRRSLHDKNIVLEPVPLEKLIVKLATLCREASNKRREVCLLVDTMLRRPVRHMLSRALSDLSIIAFSEVPQDVLLEAEAIVGLDDIYDTEAVGSMDAPASPIQPTDTAI